MARGFEEEGKEMETDAPTCASKTLKIFIAMMVQKGWLGGLRSRLDPTVFYWKDKKGMNGVMCLPVDNFFYKIYGELIVFYI